MRERESYCTFLHFNDIPETQIDEYFVCKIYFQVDLYFFYLKYSKIWNTKQANMGLAEVFRAKVEGRSSKNFLGALPPDPLSPCPPFICHIYVLIPKISGVAQGLVYLVFIGNGNSIGPHPPAPLERHDKGSRTRLALSYFCDPSAWR